MAFARRGEPTKPTKRRSTLMLSRSASPAHAIVLNLACAAEAVQLSDDDAQVCNMCKNRRMAGTDACWHLNILFSATCRPLHVEQCGKSCYIVPQCHCTNTALALQLEQMCDDVVPSWPHVLGVHWSSLTILSDCPNFSLQPASDDGKLQYSEHIGALISLAIAADLRWLPKTFRGGNLYSGCKASKHG